MGPGTKPKLLCGGSGQGKCEEVWKNDIEIRFCLHARIVNTRTLSIWKSETWIFAVEHKRFSEEEQREIVFKDIANGEITHTTMLDSAGVADYRSVRGYFAQVVMKELRLFSGYDVLYGKVKAFVRGYLFGKEVDLESANTLRNLSELAAPKPSLRHSRKPSTI